MDKSTSHDFEYDVVFSLAGEDADYVGKVAEYISNKGIKLWFYKTREAELWGENNIDTLGRIFTQSAKYCVLFISKHYVQKVWPNLEREFVQSRRLKDSQYLLPARFDNSVLDGLPASINYISLKNKTPEQFGDLIIEKVTGNAPSVRPQKLASSLPLPKVKKDFDAYEERDRWLDYIIQELKHAAQNDPNMTMYIDSGDETKRIRVRYNGKIAYSINIYKNNSFSRDTGLSFYAEHGEMRHSNINTVNAWGTFEWSKEKEEPVLNMVDMNFFKYSNQDKSLTKKQLLEAIWGKIVKEIESQFG